MNNIKVICGHCGNMTEVTPVMYEHAQSACMKFLCDKCSGIGDSVIVSDSELMNYTDKPETDPEILQLKSKNIELSDDIEKLNFEISQAEDDEDSFLIKLARLNTMKSLKQLNELQIKALCGN